MRLNEYQMLAMQGSAHDHSVYGCPEYAAAALCGEAGEIMNKLKKHWRANKRVGAPLSAEQVSDLKEELGDVLWYAAMLAHYAGFGLEEAAIGNIEKIRARRAALEPIG